METRSPRAKGRNPMMRTTLMMLAAAIALAGCAAAPQDGTHYWQHPKMGLVKVDKTTHGIVVPR
jgi:uncharacterized lipoprotein YmbA